MCRRASWTTSARHGRGEQHRLAHVVGELDQALDVGQEAEVEHPVCLVEHEHLDVGEVEGAPVGEVEQPAGSPHHHVDARLQGVELGFVRHPAVDRQNPRLADRTRNGEVGGHLQGEFARRGDDQGLRLAGRVEVVVVTVARSDDPLQQGHAERERLAGAGSRLRDQVRAGEGDGNRHLLDRERLGDADAFERVDDLGQRTEFFEGRQSFSPLVSNAGPASWSGRPRKSRTGPAAGCPDDGQLPLRSLAAIRTGSPGRQPGPGCPTARHAWPGPSIMIVRSPPLSSGA